MIMQIYGIKIKRKTFKIFLKKILMYGILLKNQKVSNHLSKKEHQIKIIITSLIKLITKAVKIIRSLGWKTQKQKTPKKKKKKKKKKNQNHIYILSILMEKDLMQTLYLVWKKKQCLKTYRSHLMIQQNQMMYYTKIGKISTRRSNFMATANA